MGSKFNFLLKLKLLKLIYLSNLFIQNKLYLGYSPLYNSYFNYLKNIQISNNLQLNNKNIYFFKNYKYNQFFFYQLFNTKLKLSNILTNYTLSYLFLFLKNNQYNTSKFNTLSNYYKNNLFFIKYYIVKFIYGYLNNKKLLFSLKKNQLGFNDNLVGYSLILNKAKRLLFLKELNINLKSFIEFLLVSLYSKDVILFKNFIKYILENIHFKKHKRFLYNLKVLLNLILNIYSYDLQLLGLYIKIKGKIGVGGNLKKRKYSFKNGSFSFTKKNQKLSYNRDIIRTYSGVLGFEIYLAYF